MLGFISKVYPFSLSPQEWKLMQWSWDHSFSSPSFTDCHTTAFTDSTSNKINILDQIRVYTAVQPAAQYCTHCFSVYIYNAITHIIWWGREGTIIMALIHYNKNPSLVTLFTWFSQASSKLCGIGTTVSTTPNDEADCARDQLGLLKKASMLKTTVLRAGGAQPFSIVFAWSNVNSTTHFC